MIFRKFKGHCDLIEKQKHEQCTAESWMDDITLICREHLSETQIRDDYKELLQLTLIYLGNVPPSGIEFHKPGSFYLSRWMTN